MDIGVPEVPLMKINHTMTLLTEGFVVVFKMILNLLKTPFSLETIWGGAGWR